MKAPRCDKNGLKKGAWSCDEDDKLKAYITRYGIWNWSKMPQFAGLSRSGRSCRLRWVNYLQPNLKRGNITKEEENVIINMYEKLGRRWSKIATRLPGRTDNEIKNYWHTNLKKRMKSQESVVPKRLEPLEIIKTPDFEVDIQNSYDSITKAETSSSSDDHNNWPSPIASAVYSKINHQIDNSRKNFEDPQNILKFLELDEDDLLFTALSHENLCLKIDSSLLKDPVTPYGFNYDYWLDLLFKADLNQIKQEQYY